MAFSNPIIGGSSTLIREAIKSPDYVAGVSGWTINKDGTAEFNDVSVRGSLRVTAPANGSYILIDASDTEAFIELQPPDDLSEGIFPGNVTANRNIGLDEGYVEINSPVFASQAASFIQWIASTSLDTGIRVQARAFLEMYADTATIQIPSVLTNALFKTLAGVEMYGRGWVGCFAESTSNSASIATTETVVLTSNSFDFEANRAYKVVSNCRYGAGGTANQPLARFRKTNLAGAIIVDSGRFNMPASNTINGYIEGIFITSSAVTAALAMTLVCNAGSITQNGSAGGPRRFDVFDIGPASRYSNYTTLS